MQKNLPEGGGIVDDELRELKKRLETQRPASWEALPDLSLYMDQVVGYMPRQLIEYGEDDRLTSAMVNNYIKEGLLPRAEGKRYNRTHLAFLTAICALKQVLPVKDAGLLAHEGDAETMYARFQSGLDEALCATAEQLDPETTDLVALARTLALHSYANKLACQRVIQLIRQSRPAPPKSKKGPKKRYE